MLGDNHGLIDENWRRVYEHCLDLCIWARATEQPTAKGWRPLSQPSIGLFPIYAKGGGLISYGPNNFDLVKQIGGIAGKILRGANPAEFPIQRPIYLSFLINIRTAKLLQLTIPPSLSALADEVIE